MKKTSIFLILLITIIDSTKAQVQVDKFTGDVMYGLPLITVPNFRGPSVSTSISYRSDIKVDQPASEVGLGWDINAGGSIERIVNGVPDDWKDAFVPDMQSAGFQNHLGALHFNSTHTSTVLDFDYTRYKMDTLGNDTFRYYFPNYDTYFVTGAGMAGKIIPENYDYANVIIDSTEVDRWFYNQQHTDSISVGIREIETYTIDEDFPFNYKTHFNYEHNFYDTISFNAFPWSSSPLNASSSIPVPIDTINPTYTGGGYNNENYSVIANRNRARTSNYIEYFTNDEIAADTITGFMEYDTTFTRGTEADFPQKGIGAYRITDPNGYTYHYSLPVYAHSNTVGNYSLDKNYNVFIAEGGYMDIHDSTDGYMVENETTHEILKLKQIKKYAVRWLLTAITGPDFEDSNGDGMVSEDDAGYWVKYDYGLWTESFEKRYPYYGATYSYSSSIDEDLDFRFLDEGHIERSPGKSLSYSETEEQIYYLNEIKTPSHTGVFCRDLRFDEQSTPFTHTSTDGGSFDISTVNDSAYYTDEMGEGSFESYHPPVTCTHTLLIKPDDYNTTWDLIDVEFVLYNCDLYNEFQITIYDGETTNSPILLYRENDDNEGDYPPSEGGTYNFTATSGTVMVKINVDSVYHYTHGGGEIYNSIHYDINWNTRFDNKLTGWPNGRQKTTPSLKLSKLFLFDNDDMGSLPAISAMDTLLNDKLWDYNNVNRSNFYNTTWYEDNQSTIDSLALQSVDLSQDYSLAQGYHNNRFVLIDTLAESLTQVEAEDYKYIATNSVDSSGKLTLNKIIYYGLNKTQTQPSHLFDYNASDSTDNPQYNPWKQDYWGNYKSDAPGNLLRGYVTDSSALHTDAWSLRTVTSPLGGTTTIVYEPDEYEQVLNEDQGGGLRGPIKMFALKNVYAVGGDVGGQWTFDLENPDNSFWDLKDNLPVGASAYTAIPCVWVNTRDSSAEGHYFLPEFSPPPLGFATSYGQGILIESGSKVDSLNFYDINWNETDTPPLQESLHDVWDYSTGGMDSLVYSGGGYISFIYPKGEKIMGGGTRVKELKVSNGTDTYTVGYAYDEGTATMEAGDFSKGKTKLDTSGTTYDWSLTSPDYNPFGLSPQVGYGKVTIENKGQVSSGQGTSVFSFYVFDEDKIYFEPYGIRIDTTRVHSDNCGFQGAPGDCNMDSKRFAVEIVDDFTSLWGKIKEQVLTDVNGYTISKKVYDYERDVRGAHVNAVNYQINDEEYDLGEHLYYEFLTCIRRKYPHYLSKVTTYSNGRSSYSEILSRDPFTADPNKTKNTSMNGTQTIEEITLAYTESSTPDYSVMGAKSVDPDYHNFLNATYSSKSYKASEGLSTPDFSSYGKSFWKDTTITRYYDTTDDEYATKTDTVTWYDYTKYVWAGELGDYGLFDSTEFTDINTPPTGSSNWRFISEITLMDEEQNVLEQKGYNNRFSASKLGYDNRFTYTSASNSNYVSFTATGFETMTEVETGVYYYEGEVVSQGDTHIKVDGNVTPHTGNYMAKIPSANIGGASYKVNFDANDSLYSLQKGRTYTASVWIHKDSPADTRLRMDIEGDTSGVSYSVSDTMSISNEDAIQIGDWIQVNVNLEVPINFTGTTVGDGLEVYVRKGVGDAWIDDMQFHSRVSGSGMNVYDQRTGRVMATLSDNNYATKYVYNDAGQVIEVWKEVLGDGWGKWVKVETRDFNFKRDLNN